MSGRGRPLRFLTLVMFGWVGVRVAVLWPQARSLPRAIEAAVPFAVAVPEPGHRSVAALVLPAIPSVQTRVPASLRPGTAGPTLLASHPDPARVQAALYGLIGFGRAKPLRPPIPPRPPASAQPFVPPARPDRWSATAWLSVRPGRRLGAAPGAGQLGGSQAGARIAYLLVPERRLAAVARVTAPLRGRGSEVAAALEWQPVARAPVWIVAEHRFGLDGIEGGPGLGVVTGVDRQAGAVRVEAYGQGGAVWRARTEPYADGAVRATHRLAGGRKLQLSLGAGVWGAAQRDAARLDVGPSATLSLPVAGKSLRLALDWRQRVAGDARPGSGPALTIGGDF